MQPTVFTKYVKLVEIFGDRHGLDRGARNALWAAPWGLLAAPRAVLGLSGRGLVALGGSRGSLGSLSLRPLTVLTG